MKTYQTKEEAEKELEENKYTYENEQLQLKCPLNELNFCSSSCVCYQKPYVTEIWYLCFPSDFSIVKSKCINHMFFGV